MTHTYKIRNLSTFEKAQLIEALMGQGGSEGAVKLIKLVREDRLCVEVK